MTFEAKRDGASIGEYPTRQEADAAVVAERRRMEDASEGGRVTIEQDGKEIWGATVMKPLNV